ncbi:serine/threonine-protein kinase WNK-like isoform X2 [Dysidea avara]|uniref:serine/threonine-protein kinase WNK-like isoform X2 n=1 Tax=Dysidea avara TaxID=196820 RepID=UPI0033258373
MATRVATDLTLYDVNPTGKEIGRGAYGRVFEVDYQGTLCAAKEVHSILLEWSQTEGRRKITTDFLNECQIWSTIRHPCIVQFLGVYYPARDQYRLPVMIMEKMQHSLRGLVEDYNNIPLNVKLSILDEVCLGLRYLHSRDPPIVHRDLTPNNILLGGRLEAKITDLGVAKVMQTDSEMTMTKIPGTPDFMPPEALIKRPVYGPPLDIFSYGGVALNVITQQWPEPSDAIQFNPKTGRREVVTEVMRRQSFLDKMTGSAVALKPLVMTCLDDEARNRPSVMEVSMEIKRIKDVCSHQTGRDGMSPIVWWAEVSAQSSSQQQVTSLTTQLEEMTINNEELRGENGVLKTENNGLKVEVDGLKVENSGLKVEVDGLKVHVDGLEVENNGLKVEVDGLKVEVDGLKGENSQLRVENQHLKHTTLMADQRSSLPPPVHPQSKQHVVPVPQKKQTREQLVQSPTPDLFSGPVNIKWQHGAPPPVEGVSHTAVLCDGKVYIGGGCDNTGPSYRIVLVPSHRIDVYNPVNNSWSPSPINTTYGFFAMTTLNNQLITAGGSDRSNKETNKIFSLDGDHLKEYTKMITPRYLATAAGYQGTLIITGGKDDQGRTLATTELFDSTTKRWFSTGQWYTTSDLPLPHYWLQSVIVDNTLYLLGGCNQYGNYSPAVFTAPLDTLSSHQLKWSSQQDTPWCYSAPVSIQGRHLLTVGGRKKTGSGYVFTSDINMFNKVSHSWEAIGHIPSARSEPAVVSVADNKIVVVGGVDDKYHCTNTVWIGSCEPQ